jgi:YHS domain-containing protein
MLRFILILLAAILLISLLRSIIGILVKGFAQALSSSDSNSSVSRAGGAPASELKKDPVCGAYVPAATSVKKMVGGGVVHFCSTTCRDKYRG